MTPFLIRCLGWLLYVDVVCFFIIMYIALNTPPAKYPDIQDDN